MQSPGERARAGIRSWVRAAGAGLRKATPVGIVAFLAASAVAPVAGAALGVTGEFAAALGQFGGMGGNYLSDVLAAAARRAGSGPSDDEWRDAVAAELLARLESGDAARQDEVAGLLDEVAVLLHAVDGVEVALRAADERTQRSLALAFGRLGRDVGELSGLATDAAVALEAIQRRLAEQGQAQRAQTDLLRQSLVITAQLRQDVLRGLPEPAAPRPAPPAGGAAPFPGLASFEAADAPFFRGRETLVAELVGRLSEQVVGGPPLVVVGVSGVGKSSVLRAGVLPAIAGGALGPGSGSWPWLVMTPGATPLAELLGRTAGLAGDAAGVTPPEAFGRSAARAGGDGRLVIVVDQFEELFTQCPDPAERAAFVIALASAAPAIVVVAVRADFYPQCTGLAPMRPLLAAGQVVVGPLGAAELRRAIDEPARDAGLTLEPGLADLLLADLGQGYEPGALPLLAHALRATWERRSGTTMTVAGYRGTGGIRDALAETAERVYLALDPPDRARLRSAMLALVTVVGPAVARRAEETEFLRQTAVRRHATPAEADAGVLRPLIDARLVTTGRDTVEISHEALLTGWPRLAGWIAEAREEILLRQRLAAAAEEWTVAGDDPDLLYRGSRLAAAREWAAGRGDVPDEPARFLAASAAAAESELGAQRRTARRLRRLVAGLAVLLLLAAAGGLVALQQRRKALTNGAVASSRASALTARSELFSDEPAAVRHALQGWESAHTTEARTALLSAQQVVVRGHLGAESLGVAVAVSPGGGLAAVGYRDGRVHLWDTTTLRRVGTDLTHPGNYLVSLRFSPDGRFLASGSLSAAGAAVWEVPSGRFLTTLYGLGPAAWLPDSSAVLVARPRDGSASWIVAASDPRDGRQVGATPIEVPSTFGLAVSPDGTTIALGGEKGGQIVRRADGRSLARWPGRVRSIAFTPGGDVVAADVDGRLTRWDGAHRTALTGRSDRVGNGQIAITPDGTVLASDDGPNSIVQIKLDGTAGLPLSQFGGVANDLGLSADGHVLVVVGLNSPPLVLRIGTHQLPHNGKIGYLAFDRSGTLLATGSDDPDVRIWDLRTRTLVRSVRVPDPGGPSGLGYGPDGTLVITMGNGTILFVGADGAVKETFRVGSGLFAANPAFSPDGSSLAVTVSPATSDRAVVNARPGVEDVLVFDAATRVVRARAETPGHAIRSLAFTPDGAHLIAAATRSRGAVQGQSGNVSDGYLWMWRTSDLGREAMRIVPEETLNALRISPDGRQVAVGTQQKRVALFRVEGLEPAGSIAAGSSGIAALAYAPDGRTLATVGTADNEQVTIWDTGSGGRVNEFLAYGMSGGALTFSPDGSLLATANRDWTVNLWRTDPEDVKARLCRLITPIAEVARERVPAGCPGA